MPAVGESTPEQCVNEIGLWWVGRRTLTSIAGIYYPAPETRAANQVVEKPMDDDMEHRVERVIE